MQKIDFVNAQEPAINDTNLNQMQLNIENAINAQVSGDTLPVGCIVPFTSDTLPENWLLCDGQAVSRTEYDLLFSIIGTTYGVGDGSTTFNLPNLKGRVAVGKDSTQTEFDTLGETGGEKTHTLTVDEMPSHEHNIIDAGNGAVRPLGYGESNQHTGIVRTDANINWNDHVFRASSTGGGQAHNILQPYQVTNYIIKARQASGLVATVVDNLNSTSTTDALSANQGRLLGKYSIHNEIVVGHWIDNKPIYRKVINFGALPNATQKKINHNISNIDNIVKIDGFTSDGNTFTSIPLVYKGSDSAYNAEMVVTRTEIICGASEDRSRYTSTYVIIEYTKTTD